MRQRLWLFFATIFLQVYFINNCQAQNVSFLKQQTTPAAETPTVTLKTVNNLHNRQLNLVIDSLTERKKVFLDRITLDSARSMDSVGNLQALSNDSVGALKRLISKNFIRISDSLKSSIDSSIKSVNQNKDGLITYDLATLEKQVKDSSKSAVEGVIKEFKEYVINLPKSRPGISNDSIRYYFQQRDLEERNKIDSIRQQESFLLSNLNLTKSYSRHEPMVLPATNESAAVIFFTEKDSIASRFFANNSLSYNSSIQKLSFSNETYYDIFGPFRLGLGFALTSSSSQADSLKAKDDAAQKIIAGGGNINWNLGFPLFKWTDERLIVQTKVLASYKGGVDIPKDSASSSTYGFLNDIGVNFNFYSNGLLNRIQLFESTRISYLVGNKNFANRLGTNDFWMAQNSLGIAVQDKFRMRLDYYLGFGNSAGFIRKNFPITVSFDIVNPF